MPLASSSNSIPLVRNATLGRIGNWELLRKIHAGACFDVYLARPRGSHQCADYVVKVLRDHLQEDPIARDLFHNEVEASFAIQHPHLTTVFEAIGAGRPEDNGAQPPDEDGHSRQPTRPRTRCLVLPRLEGVTLDVLHREGQCGLRRALRTVRQTAEALAAMHAQGWRHGDVKPANIMVSPEGHATLIDLSLAAPFHSPVHGGTPPYTAPEMEQGRGAGASDIFSLGVVLCELLIGDELCEKSIDAMTCTWPPGALQLMRRMLQADPNDRPHAAEVIDELTPLEIQCFQAPAALIQSPAAPIH